MQIKLDHEINHSKLRTLVVNRIKDCSNGELEKAAIALGLKVRFTGDCAGGQGAIYKLGLASLRDGEVT
jgi:hypothetical protein